MLLRPLGRQMTDCRYPYPAREVVLYIVFVGNDRGGDCGPYNISKEDCRAIRSMSQKERRESIDDFKRQQERDHYR